MPRRAAKPKTLAIDFTGVEAGGIAVKDGRYIAEVISCESTESQSGNPMLTWKLKLPNGAVITDYTVLIPNSLWKLKTLLICMGYEIPDGQYDLDPTNFKGETVGVEILNELYQGESRPKINRYFPNDEETEDEPNDDETVDEPEPAPEPKKRRGRPPKAKVVPLKKGVKVKWTDEEEEYQGVITSVDDGGIFTVTDSNDEEWELVESDLTTA